MFFGESLSRKRSFGTKKVFFLVNRGALLAFIQAQTLSLKFVSQSKQSRNRLKLESPVGFETVFFEVC